MILEKANVRCIHITSEQSAAMRDEAITKFYSDDSNSPKVLVATHSSFRLVDVSPVCDQGIIIGATASVSRTYGTMAALLHQSKTRKVKWSLFWMKNTIDDVLESRAWAEYQENVLADRCAIDQYIHFHEIAITISHLVNRWLGANLFIPMGCYNDGVIRSIREGLKQIMGLVQQQDQQGPSSAPHNEAGDDGDPSALFKAGHGHNSHTAPAPPSDGVGPQLQDEPVTHPIFGGRLRTLNTVDLIVAA